MEIKNVTAEDSAELLAIYAPYVENTTVTFEQHIPTVYEFTKRIVDITKNYPYIKAVSDSGEILGYAYAGRFKPRESYDWSVELSIYVKNDCHRNGIGSLLYAELENRLKAIGIINLYACVAVPQGDDPYLTTDSILFHEDVGFKKVGVFHNCASKFGRWYDMEWLEKFIGEHNPNPEKVDFKK